MSILLENLPEDIQLSVKKQLARNQDEKSVQELYDTTVLVVVKLITILSTIEDADEYSECKKMIRGKQKEIKDYTEIIDMEKKMEKRKKLQAKIMMKALE